MLRAASSPDSFVSNDFLSIRADVSAPLDDSNSKVARHFIKVPILSYLPSRLSPRFTNSCYLTFGVVGDLDRALTINANQLSAVALLEAAETLRESSSLICIKGFNQRDDLIGFRRLPAFPRALLKLTPNYWQSLSGKRRSDLLRQRKAARDVRREIVDGFPTEFADEILALYRQTRANARLKLLNHDLSYFKRTSPVSSYLLYFHEQRLIAFHQMVAVDRTLYSQYVGMDYAISKPLRLYFNLLLDCIDFALQAGFLEIDFGITSYRYKQHIGCELQATWNYFQISNRYMAWALPLFDSLLTPRREMLE